MSIQVKQGDFTLEQNRVRDGANVVPIWAPAGGFFPKGFPGDLHSMHRLCQIAELGDLAREAINERTAFQVGKERKTISDGQNWTFTLTGVGNAIDLQAALLGQSLAAHAGIRQGQTKSQAGHLFLFEGDDSGNIRTATVIPNCSITLSQISGASDGESNLTIEVESASEAWRTGDFVTPVREIWFDGTSTRDGSTAITNAAAPDGLLTAFTLGTGNNTGATDAPLAVAFNADAAGSAGEYILEVKVNGSVTTAYTYNASSGVLTFTSAPADGATIEVVYFVRIDAETWSSTKVYGAGAIVKQAGAYFVSASATTAGASPADGAPWGAYTGFGWDGAAGVGSPVVPYLTGNKFDMFESFNDLMLA